MRLLFVMSTSFNFTYDDPYGSDPFVEDNPDAVVDGDLDALLNSAAASNFTLVNFLLTWCTALPLLVR